MKIFPKVNSNALILRLSAIGAIILVAWFLHWINNRNERLVNEFSRYYYCVIEEYGMTPYEWHNLKGEYPDCG